MRIGIIIPDRGDRPKFLEHLFKMMQGQSFIKNNFRVEGARWPIEVDKTLVSLWANGHSIHVELINEEIVAPANECDITKRYKTGYGRLRNMDLDVIFLMENDDWYAPDYLDTMINEWEKANKPDLFGTSYTIYYNLREKAYLTMQHFTRSSAMSTLIKPDLDFKWCKDSEPYTDIHLWQTLKGIIYTPEKVICLGIKHGVGLCGGELHTTKLDRYANKDFDMSYLKSILDEESFEFYSNLFPAEN